MKTRKSNKIYTFKKGVGTVKRTFDSEGNIEKETVVANFATRIVKQTRKTPLDGDDQIILELESKLYNNTKLNNIAINSSDFEGLSWIPKGLGVRAFLCADASKKDLIQAIRQFSSKMTDNREYQFSGYACIDSIETYLSQGTSITMEDGADAITVALPPSLKYHTLPLPSSDADEVVSSIAQTNKLLTISDRNPAIGAVMVSSIVLPLINMDDGIEFAIYFVGNTGTYKTGISALVQKHYGEQFSRRNLPGNWMSTDNSMPMPTQIMRHATIVYDDLKYDSQRDIGNKNNLLERLVRGTANASVRQRKNEFKLHEFNSKPASLPLITAEIVPICGESLIGRMILLDIQKDDVELDVIKGLSRPFAVGSFTQTTSSFIAFVTGNKEKIHRMFESKKTEYEAIINKKIPLAHERLAPNFSSLIASLYIYRCFVIYCKALNKAKADSIFEQYKDAIIGLALRQREIKLEFNVDNALNHMFIAAISHEKIEYRSFSSDRRLNMQHLYGETTPRRSRSDKDIIWIDKTTREVYINSQFNVSRLTKYFASNFTVDVPTKTAFWKFLKNSGFLKSCESNRRHNTIRKTIKGSEYIMYHTRFRIPHK